MVDDLECVLLHAVQLVVLESVCFEHFQGSGRLGLDQLELVLTQVVHHQLRVLRVPGEVQRPRGHAAVLEVALVVGDPLRLHALEFDLAAATPHRQLVFVFGLRRRQLRLEYFLAHRQGM